MKIKLTILEAETHDKQGNVKKTSGNKVFARFKTSEGWYSCFEQNIIETLKLLVNHEVVVNTEESKDGKYKHINGIYPDGEQEEESDYTDAVRRVDEQDSINMNTGEHKMNSKPKDNKDFPKYTPSKQVNNNAAMYVSYAKDLMCAYMTKLEPKELATMDFSVTMAQCVEVVNNAKKIFS